MSLSWRLRYWLGGGRRRWVERALARLPALLSAGKATPRRALPPPSRSVARVLEGVARAASALAQEGAHASAMSSLGRALALLPDEDAAAAPVWAASRAALLDRRAALLELGRAHFAAQVAAPPGTRREALLASADFEERAEEWAAAARLVEAAAQDGRLDELSGDRAPDAALGDRLRAAALWEKDERYGEAVRVLAPVADQPEAQLRGAELRERGGDAAGAAAQYEQLRRWAEARRAYRAAGQPAAAARCYLREHGEDSAARSEEYGELMAQSGQQSALLQLLLARLAHAPGDQVLRRRLRWLVGERGAQLEPSRLLEAARETLADGGGQGELRRRFDRRAATWIEEAHQALRRRYSRVWGMDLGTSKSAVALLDLEKREAVICPHRGHPHYPSTLALDKQGHELVGLSALEQLRPDLRGCVERSKRAMGTRSRYRIADRHFSPEEVAARLIGHGRTLVEEHLRALVRERVLAAARAELDEDCPPQWLEGAPWADKLTMAMPEAVITVPAYFNFDQRRATRDAAEIAGVKVPRLLPEPTAACLAIGLTRKLPGKMLVVDLGAGTLDLSYLEASYLDKDEGFFEVAKIFGDSQFGAADFDAVLEAHFLAALEKEGVTLGGLDRRRLHAAVEQLKIELSTSASARQELRSFAGKASHALELTAARLEELLRAQLERLERTCKLAAGLPVDHLVLVGGPMFSPLVRRRVEQALGRKADAVVDPRTAVASGAAYQAALLSNNAQVPFLLLDIVPFALGVLVKPRAEEGKPSVPAISFHIPRGTRIPHDSKKPYTTTTDDQPAVDIEVFHGTGETTDPAAATRMAKLHLEGLPPAKAGVPRIDVTFAIDHNGLLEVTARDERTGKSKSIRVEDATWLSPAERAAMTERMGKSQRFGEEAAELAERRRRLEGLLEELAELERRDDAGAWQRQFAAWQAANAAAALAAGAALESADQELLAEMYNQGQVTCDQAQLGFDRARNLRPTAARFLEAAAQVSGFAEPAAVAAELERLRGEGQRLEEQARACRDEIEPRARRLRGYGAALTRITAALVDPRQRWIVLHDAGEWLRADEAYRQGVADAGGASGAGSASAAAASAAEPAASDDRVLHRRLDLLARLGDRERYRALLAEHQARLEMRELCFDRLNEFGRHVRQAMAWIVAGPGTGSGFLAAPDLVATNRHVVCEDKKPLPVAALKVQVGGAAHPVGRVLFPPDAGIDLALLELVRPLPTAPVRVGYSGLVEVGERVLAIGFPLPEGESFEENLLLDHGIVNRIRVRPGLGRELELGLKISPGMSGGPIFNDRGEVIAVSTFVRYQPMRGHQLPVLEKSAHAISVEALHELLPRRW